MPHLHVTQLGNARVNTRIAELGDVSSMHFFCYPTKLQQTLEWYFWVQFRALHGVVRTAKRKFIAGFVTKWFQV